MPREDLETGEVMRISEELTPRQLEVLKLAANGKSSPQIAKILKIGVNRVKEHKFNIRHKLGAYDFLHAIEVAKERGIIE